MKVAVLGAGKVGGALGQGWSRVGHAISYGVPDPADPEHRRVVEASGDARLDTVTEAVRGVDVIVLAVPFGAVGAALAAAGDLSGKVLVDCTNPLRIGLAGPELSLGFDRSAAEHVASLAPGASVFKTLNQVGFEIISDTTGFAAEPVMFVAGDDQAQKPLVMQLVRDLGFQAVDAGDLTQARLLEAFGMLWIHMSLKREIGRGNIFAYLPRQINAAAA